MEEKTGSSARFDARLSKEQKEYFEYAAKLGGYRTLSEFMIHSAQETAKKIIMEHEQILKTEKDRELFFDELLNPAAPNTELRQAAEEYQKYLRKNELSD